MHFSNRFIVLHTYSHSIYTYPGCESSNWSSKCPTLSLLSDLQRDQRVVLCQLAATDCPSWQYRKTKCETYSACSISGFFPPQIFQVQPFSTYEQVLVTNSDTKTKCWAFLKEPYFSKSETNKKEHLSWLLCQFSIYFTSFLWNPECYRSFPDRSQGPPTVPSGGRGFSNFIGKDHLGVRETSLRINS